MITNEGFCRTHETRTHRTLQKAVYANVLSQCIPDRVWIPSVSMEKGFSDTIRLARVHTSIRRNNQNCYLICTWISGRHGRSELAFYESDHASFWQCAILIWCIFSIRERDKTTFRLELSCKGWVSVALILRNQQRNVCVWYYIACDDPARQAVAATSGQKPSVVTEVWINILQVLLTHRSKWLMYKEYTVISDLLETSPFDPRQASAVSD